MSGAHISRRSFLGTALGAGSLALSPAFLAGCGGSETSKGGVSSADLSGVLPSYVPATGGPAPDLPSVTGAASAATDPGFLSYPADQVRTVSAVPGRGGSYRAVTPLWGPIPKAGNSYYRAVNAALGAELEIRPTNGNNYAQTVPTLVAGNKLPDWIQIPTWWNANVNVGELAARKFADLTPFLAGDKVRKYPHLAAIPSGGWQAGVWQNKLHGIPSYTSQANFAGALFYRKDVLDERGIGPAEIRDAESLLALGKELTSTSANVWAFDVLWLVVQQIFKVPPLSSAVTVVDGKVVSAYETPQVKEALAFAHRMAKSGYVHPDSLAGNDSNAKQRFYSGKVLVQADGPGSWNTQDSVQGRAANPDYVRGALPLFAHDGSTPTIALGASASVMSYLNKELTPAQIEECLAIANYLAAPYGSFEYTLINYGVAGEDWTREDGAPTYTTQGTKQSNQTTYQFLASPRNIVTNPGREDITRAAHEWAAGAVKHAYKPPFWNLNVSPPTRFASISTGTQVNDVIKEVTFGKKSVAEFTSAATNWKNTGGGQLIDWYQKEVVDKYGTGQ